MKLLVILLAAVSAWAAPQGYGGGSGGGSFVSGGGSFPTCLDGEVLNIDGSCARPTVTRKIFVYAAPESPLPPPPPVQIPEPEVAYNIVFIKSPSAPAPLDPVVIPPPIKKTLVYVLSKKPEIEQQVIQVPDGPQPSPEVYYIRYGDGENPVLPGGIDLDAALGAADGHLAGDDGGYGSGEIIDNIGPAVVSSPIGPAVVSSQIGGQPGGYSYSGPSGSSSFSFSRSARDDESGEN